MKTLLPACQYLMAISLMAHIPNDPVERRIEHVMKRNCQLHRSKARPQMSWILRQYVNNVLTQLRANLPQLVGW